MKRFSSSVKVFVLEERAQRKGWKVIKERIKEQFHIEPPTTRAMQKWENNLDREALSAEIRKDLETQTSVVGDEARQKIISELLPQLWRSKDAGQDVELAAWKWFFTVVENQLGTDKFKYILEQYSKDRKKETSDPDIHSQ